MKLLFVFANLALSAQQAYYGTWRIESASVAPWSEERNPAGPTDLIGKSITISPRAITGPEILACPDAMHTVKDMPVEGLFQGAFHEMHEKNSGVSPSKLAAAAGLRGTSWKTLDPGCAFEFHFIDARHAVFALDNRIYRIRKVR